MFGSNCSKALQMQIKHDYKKVWDEVSTYSATHNFTGYNKHDGLNSPILKSIFGHTKWTRIIAIQGVMRLPFNIRPLLFVKKALNPKGISLFLRSYLNIYSIDSHNVHLDTIHSLIATLVSTRVKTISGYAWGYHYPWQDLGFFAPAGTPNAVVTSFVCNSLLHAYTITNDESLLRMVKESIEFFLNDLTTLKNEDDELCLSYMPLPMKMRVMDVSILIGSVIVKYYKFSGDDTYNKPADRLVNYVVNQQTDCGAWFYTDPPKDSHITHDNYHTGFILDALWDYMHASGNFDAMPKYEKGLTFYAENLFELDGAPRWMSNKQFPHDVHGSAQGVITFSRHDQEFPGLSRRIASWGLDNLYSGDGRFYYQKERFHTKTFTLMRWCNAWMAFALSQQLQYYPEK